MVLIDVDERLPVAQRDHAVAEPGWSHKMLSHHGKRASRRWHTKISCSLVWMRFVFLLRDADGCHRSPPRGTEVFIGHYCFLTTGSVDRL